MVQTKLMDPYTMLLEIDMSGNQSNDVKRLFTVKEAANELRVSTWLLYELIRTNQLKSVSIASRRFIANEDIDNFINRQREKEYAT